MKATRQKLSDIKITFRKVADLIPYARNSRTHSEEQIDQIVASIEEFGFTNPVLTDAKGEIIAGHGRVLAAQKKKILEVPCVDLLHLTAKQRRAYVIADNAIALNAGWDLDLLKLEMQELDADGFDVSLIGIDPALLAEELAEPPKEKGASSLEVIAECHSEDEQRMVFNILTGKGISCRMA